MYSSTLLKELLNKKELEISDLQAWYDDYNEVRQFVNARLKKVKDKTHEEQTDFILWSFKHVLAYSVCSDVNFEPIKYIDFNFGSITCTISWYDRQNGELLPYFDGYISRNGEELEGCYTDIGINEVEEVLKEYKEIKENENRN